MISIGKEGEVRWGTPMSAPRAAKGATRSTRQGARGPHAAAPTQARRQIAGPSGYDRGQLKNRHALFEGRDLKQGAKTTLAPPAIGVWRLPR